MGTTIEEVTGVDKMDVEALGRRFRGQLIQPGDSSYEAARQVWNGTIDRRPALIARCAGVGDVAAALSFAETHDLVVAVRGGGHSVAGYGTCDGGIVIDLSGMKGIRVDPANQIVRAEGGVTWGELDYETQGFGLATPGGVVSTTGIAGLTLGGGYGWLSRRFGASVDNLLSADVVSADGRLLTASRDENEDLFWALRGGGGGFGIVTSLEYRLHPVGPTVFGGYVGYPMEQATDLLRFCREWMPTAPDELSMVVVMEEPRPDHALPAELHGKPLIQLALCYSGPVENGEKVSAAVRDFGTPAIDQLGPLAFTDLQSMYDSYVPHGICAYWKTGHLNELSDEAIETCLAEFAKRHSSRSLLVIEYLEGAFGRRDGDATAFNHQGEPYRMLIEALWTDKSDSEANVAWARDYSTAITPFSSGGVYVNYLGEEGEDQVRAAYGPEKHERLVQLKQKYDPANIFRLNKNVVPEHHAAAR